jgi:hypothetical protein
LLTRMSQRGLNPPINWFYRRRRIWFPLEIDNKKREALDASPVKDSTGNRLIPVESDGHYSTN